MSMLSGEGSNQSSSLLESSGYGSVSHNDYPGNKKTVNPFEKYEDKEHPYAWPSLYDEMDDMFDACCLLYALAELRQKVRQGDIDDQNILNLPLTALEVCEVVKDNRQCLKDCHFGNEFYLELLLVLAKRQQNIAASTRNLISHRVHSHVVAFNDCNYQEEMVYGIAVNPTQKRITVCFRGSISKLDWAMDREIYMTSIDNPVPASKVRAGSKLRIHNGFYNYLCAPISQVRLQAQKTRGIAISEHPEELDGLSQYQKILQKHIIPLLKQHPGYKIYVTGHSLGAALATLFAFLIAAEPDSVIPKPVTCVSFGSPYVGDGSFRLAHQTLESMGKLRHLRVSNHQDLVTLIPFVSFRWKFWDADAHVGSFFKHVGINLRFFAASSSAVPYQIFYPRVRSGYFSAIIDEWNRGWHYSFLGNCSCDLALLSARRIHGLQEYQRRIEDNMPTLEIMRLNDLYGRKAIVGHLHSFCSDVEENKDTKMD